MMTLSRRKGFPPTDFSAYGEVLEQNANEVKIKIPRARIVTLFPLVVYWAIAEIPAALFLPVWFAMQFFNGFLALAAAQRTQEAIGIAWWAHVGGFLFGAAVGMGVRWGKRENRTAEVRSSKLE